ncbi:MAG: type II secretion system F family protein [Gammaproteobacteria bacterium]|jgi:MSHA biogenesis protein MshG|nr:type II secretion system F family protein [Gammaproteobacteria bacterium]
MPRFEYRGRLATGAASEGEIEATNEASAAKLLSDGGIVPVAITPVQVRPERTLRLPGLGHRLPGLEDLLLFTRQIYALERAGVPILRALNGLAQGTRNPHMRKAISDIGEALEAGRNLSSAFGEHPKIFPSLFVSIVKVGETTGRLEEAFQTLSEYIELEIETRRRVKTAVRYPVFVLTAITIAIAVMNILVIPAFANVFLRFDLELPWATRLLIGISDMFVNGWPYMLGVIVAAIFGVRHYLGTDAGRLLWDRYKLRLPLVGDIIMRATLARFARAFAMSYRSGVPLLQTLSTTARAVDNVHVGYHIGQMREGISRGDSLSRTANATGLFTPLTLQMLAVGEETGAVDDMMQEVASYYEREVDYDLKQLSDTIEPVLIVAIGIMVLIVALGVFLPMWDLTQIARR